MKRRSALPVLLVVVALASAACGGSKPSPADSQIAFVTSRDGDYAIYGMRSDGGDQVRLTNNDAGETSSPARAVYFQFEPDWSPDGKRIVFTSRRAGKSHVYVMNADGSGTRQLTSGSHDDAAPAWSPDGRRIAFARDNYLYLMTPEGASIHRVTRELGGEERDPAWSRDGTWIAYTYRRPGFRTREVWRVHPDGSGRGQVTHLNANAVGPSVSRDGKTIVFSSNVDDNRYQLYEIGANGKRLRRLTYEPSDYFDPSWSPDGKTLLFERDGLIYVRGASGVETAITNGPNDGSPAWRPVQPPSS